MHLQKSLRNLNYLLLEHKGNIHLEVKLVS